MKCVTEHHVACRWLTFENIQIKGIPANFDNLGSLIHVNLNYKNYKPAYFDHQCEGSINLTTCFEQTNIILMHIAFLHWGYSITDDTQPHNAIEDGASQEICN